MKSYTITVNGTAYDVTVEENQAGSVNNTAPAARSTQAAPKKEVQTGNRGNLEVEAGAAGKVFKINATVGSKVKKGQPILTLEVMKMETPVVATEDGTVASIEVTEGQQIESGELLATMNV